MLTKVIEYIDVDLINTCKYIYIGYLLGIQSQCCKVLEYTFHCLVVCGRQYHSLSVATDYEQLYHRVGRLYM